MNQQPETLITVMCAATIRAAGQIVADRPTLPKPDAEKLAGALREAVKAHYDELLSDMWAADQAHMGEPILRAQMNASATEWAIAALKAIGFLPTEPAIDK